MLFAALALYGDRPAFGRFVWVFAPIGVLTAISFCFALEISGRAIKRLEDTWDRLKERREKGFEEIDVIGYRYRGRWEILFPWHALPVVIAVGWVLLAVSPLFCPTGTRSAQPQSMITQIDDTTKSTIIVQYQGTVDGLRDFIEQLEAAAKSP